MGGWSVKVLSEVKDEEDKETRYGKYGEEKHISRGKKNSKFPKQEYVQYIAGTLRKLISTFKMEGGMAAKVKFREVIGAKMWSDLKSEWDGSYYFWVFE